MNILDREWLQSLVFRNETVTYVGLTMLDLGIVFFHQSINLDCNVFIQYDSLIQRGNPFNFRRQKWLLKIRPSLRVVYYNTKVNIHTYMYH